MSQTPATRPSTRLIHAGEPSGELSRTVGPPIQRGSTVLMPSADALYDESRPTYGRGGLETHQTLMSALAELENATTVRLYPSGLAALTGAMLAVLSSGDDILVSDGAYKPTRRFCDHALRRFGVRTRYYDPATSALDLLAMALPETRLIVMESPSSLTFEVQDVPAIAALAKARGILTLVDNTWAAGLLFKPLDHGVDISAQALTKYVGGHSDVFMGSAASRDAVVGRALDQSIWDFGWAVSPDDAYQMLRGLRTLPVRLERHGASALTVARWLSTHAAVSRVLHPALPRSPGHEAWARDYAGSAGVFGVVLKTADIAKTHAFLDALQLFGLGFSWGGFESLALDADPQLIVRQFPPRFGGALIRLNIGLEDPADLIADLDQALAKAA
jgi:cystathionine beta-lyase